MFNLIKSLSLDTWYTVGAATISFLLGFGIPITKKFLDGLKKKKNACKHPLFCDDTGKEFTKVHSQINEILKIGRAHV